MTAHPASVGRHGWPTWEEIEPTIRDRAYRRIEGEPEFLLEQDVWGFPNFDADLIYARFIGFDEQVVKDGVRLARVDHHYLMPIPLSPRALWTDEIAPGVHKIDGVEIWMPPTLDTLRVAEYALQSCYTTCFVSGEYRPPVEKLRPDFTAKVAYVRYRRRS